MIFSISVGSHIRAPSTTAGRGKNQGSFRARTAIVFPMAESLQNDFAIGADDGKSTRDGCGTLSAPLELCRAYRRQKCHQSATRTKKANERLFTFAFKLLILLLILVALPGLEPGFFALRGIRVLSAQSLRAAIHAITSVPLQKGLVRRDRDGMRPSPVHTALSQVTRPRTTDARRFLR
jgi:hypothetical protein